MKSKIALIILAFMVSISSYGQSIERAKRLMEKEQWKKAKKELIEQLKTNPLDSWANYYLGDVYMELSQIDSAEICYKNALIDPKNMFPVAGQGRIALKKGDNATAQQQFQAAINGAKKNADLYAYIADVYLKETKDTANANKYIMLGKERNSKNVPLFMTEAKMFRMKGEHGKAVDNYERRVLFQDTKNTSALVQAGSILAGTRVYEPAEESIKKALAIDSLDVQSYKALGEIYFNWKGHKAEASKMYKKYMQLAGEDASIEDKKKYAFALCLNEEYADATKVMEELTVINPKDYVLLRLKAFMAFALNNFDAGLGYSNQFFEVQKDTTKYLIDDYVFAAKLQSANKLDSLAVISYTKAFQMDTTNTENLKEAASILYKAKKYVDAAKYYEKLTSINSGVPAFYLSLGRSYYYSIALNKADTLAADSVLRKITWESADSAFSRASRLNPKIYSATYARASAASIMEINNGIKGFSKPYYEKAIESILTNYTPETIKGIIAKDLVTCYRYLAIYYYTNAFNLKTTKTEEYKKLKALSIDYCTKGLAVDPAEKFLVQIQKAFIDLENPAVVQKKGKKEAKSENQEQGVPAN